MKKTIDLTGHIFGKWKVLGLAEKRNKIYYWNCLCQGCNREFAVNSGNLRAGETLSCKRCKKQRDSHKLRRTVEYDTLLRINRRCLKADDRDFPLYGGRGIKVCKGLTGGDKIEFFLSLVGKRPESYSINRIDNNGHYSCGKCQECLEKEWSLNIEWADNRTQSRNKRNNVLVTYKDREWNISDLLKNLKITPKIYYDRIKKGLTPQEALYSSLNRIKKPRKLKES